MGKKKYLHSFIYHASNQRSGNVSSLSDSLSGWLSARGMAPQQSMLLQLWKNWSIVMGPFTDIAHPLGHRKDILLIGGDDPCAMQELSYSVPEILERANAFMNENFFTRVELHLLTDKNSLQRVDITSILPVPRPERPFCLGNLKLPPDSPLASAYEAYVKFFNED